MNHSFVFRNQSAVRLARVARISVCGLLFACSLAALAESTIAPADARTPFSIRATHLLGFENTKNNCNGTLSIQDGALQFQQGSKPADQVKLASIQAALLGSESKQVGGVPMKLGKAAAPYGGGRVVSLFAHKKYDTLTVEYVDTNGGVHGAIFQLSKGEGELVISELLARGARISGTNHSTKQSTAEVRYENK